MDLLKERSSIKGLLWGKYCLDETSGSFYLMLTSTKLIPRDKQV
jgi:hypothetical protein